MSDDVKMALICFGPLVLFAVLGIAYFAWQDWLLASATKKAIEAQKEVYLNMSEKCRECPYCTQKKENNQ